MADSVTKSLEFRLREVGSIIHVKDWGNRQNDELLRLDNAIAQVCTPEQIAEIRRLLGKTEML